MQSECVLGVRFSQIAFLPVPRVAPQLSPQHQASVGRSVLGVVSVLLGSICMTANAYGGNTAPASIGDAHTGKETP